MVDLGWLLPSSGPSGDLSRGSAPPAHTCRGRDVRVQGRHLPSAPWGASPVAGGGGSSLSEAAAPPLRSLDSSHVCSRTHPMSLPCLFDEDRRCQAGGRGPFLRERRQRERLCGDCGPTHPPGWERTQAPRTLSEPSCLMFPLEGGTGGRRTVPGEGASRLEPRTRPTGGRDCGESTALTRRLRPTMEDLLGSCSPTGSRAVPTAQRTPEEFKDREHSALHLGSARLKPSP